jgi:hypothetical protein
MLSIAILIHTIRYGPVQAILFNRSLSIGLHGIPGNAWRCVPLLYPNSLAFLAFRSGPMHYTSGLCGAFQALRSGPILFTPVPCDSIQAFRFHAVRSYPLACFFFLASMPAAARTFATRALSIS